MYVAPWALGQGCGRDLLGALLDRCRVAGLREVVAVIADGGDPASVELHRRFGSTLVLVTHDQSEALAMSDNVAVMSEGLIVQCGAPRTVYDKPVNDFVAGFHTRGFQARGEGAGVLG